MDKPLFKTIPPRCSSILAETTLSSSLDELAHHGLSPTSDMITGLQHLAEAITDMACHGPLAAFSPRRLPRHDPATLPTMALLQLSEVVSTRTSLQLLPGYS